MKINFDSNILLLNGKPIVGPDKNELTLKDVCVESLLATFPKEDVSGKVKFERYSLAAAINKGGVQEMKAEEISKLKELIGRVYTTAVVGPVFLLLDS